MPFGSLTTTYRLGIANADKPDAFRWAREVLRLSIETFPQSFPVYQQQVVHRNDRWEQGPASPAAEQCWDSQADSEIGLNNVIRQASAFDTLFSWRNLTPGTNTSPRKPPKAEYSVDQHSNNRYGQVYYVQNEPEAYSQSRSLPDTTEACLAGAAREPRNDIIDRMIDTNGIMPFSTFYEYSGLQRRVKAQVLALVFLRIKQRIEAKFSALNKHLVITAVPSAPMLGAFVPPPPTQADRYWSDFYDAVRDGVSIQYPFGGSTFYESESGVPPKDLKVLHLHHYTAPRFVTSNNTQLNLPLETVAEGTYGIKSGVNWFRDRYNKNSQNQPIGALDMDILLSEMGPDWRISGNQYYDTNGNAIEHPYYRWAWAGGWNNFRDGLSWWNSWLCWLMRRAPIQSECNLTNSPNGVKTDAHALYACIHASDILPYSTTQTSGVSLRWTTNTTTRNQIFFNADTWLVGSVSGKEFINSPLLNPPVSQQPNFYGRYQTSFSAFDPTSWDPTPGTTTNTAWRIGPLGACYKVWSQIASDFSQNTSFGTGWYSNSQAGIIGETTIDLPGGYSTVYFPVIKASGTFAANTQFNVTWRKSGRPDYVFGYFGADEFPDTTIFNQIRYNFNTGVYGSLVNIPSQTIYSSMIFPVVCYSALPQTVTVRLSRNISGASVSLGRPIVLRQACSWLSNQ
jgi:hypothetical protein